MVSVDDAWVDAEMRFDIIAKGMAVEMGVTRPLPKLSLTRTQAPDVTARVLRIAPNHVQVQFGDGFLASVLNLIDGLSDQQLADLLRPDGPDSSSPEDLEKVRVVLYAVAEQFVMHHELFHVLCGHLDQRAAALGNACIALDERALAASAPNPSQLSRGLADDLPLFVELEADVSALSFLADRCALGDMALLIENATDQPISALDGAEKAMAFLRIPRHPGHRSALMADSIPP